MHVSNAEITIALICIPGYSTAFLPIPVVVQAHSCHVLLHLRLVSSYQDHGATRTLGSKSLLLIFEDRQPCEMSTNARILVGQDICSLPCLVVQHET
jgi:hypothetical protein